LSFENDKLVLRELGKKYAEVAALPVQKENVRLWKALNGLKPERPMVMIDQLPIHELAKPGDGLLDCYCADAFLRETEFKMRLTLLKFAQFPGDMAVLPVVRPDPAVTVTGGYAGLISESVLKTDPENAVVSHKYGDVLKTEDDLQKLTEPAVNLDRAETGRRMDMLKEIFDGVLEVVPGKAFMSFNVWDRIATLKGVSNALDDLIDRPDFVHALVDRMFRIYRSTYEQYESLGLLDPAPDAVHSTGAYSDELPKKGFTGNARICDTWSYTMSQMFSSVSPSMDKEFQIDYAEKYLSDIGMLYYGCCEPLHDRIELILRLKNVRKISVSPWADLEISAGKIAGKAVLSRKPNPAYLAFESFDEGIIKKELAETLQACKRHGAPCELILKDISTVRYQPERLRKWNRIAMDLVNNYQ